MVAAGPAGPAEERLQPAQITELIPLVRRIVAARIPDRATVDDLVQETLARLLAAVGRIEPGMLEPYAIVTARNMVASHWRDQDRQRRHQHRVIDLRPPDAPDEDILARENRDAVIAALTRLTDRERETLLAHEVSGQDTRSLAAELGSTAGAVAAQLNRTRARLRVEYLLAVEHTEPPTDRCRPVLLALSSADRRRQREVDAARHLLECDLCARLSEPLVGRARSKDDAVRVAVRTDADVVAARQAARDAGPGIPDVEQALQDGYSTYQGLGLGLPGARRLMDEFAVVSETGRGTTVTMTKWRGE